jgi:type II secretory pathway pseudopilin PulG
MRSGSGGLQQRGSAYLLLLVSVALLGLAAAASVSIGVNASRRNAEYELLEIGSEFERALATYRATAPAGARSGPKEIDDLLLDRHHGGLKRHLRKLYADPLTGRAQWGLVRHPDGSIVGVFSLATGTPIKRSGFQPVKAYFEEAESYSSWVFGGQVPASKGTD